MPPSRLVTPRRDLRDLAAQLNEREIAGALWRADAPGALTPFLRLDDGHESSLEPDEWLAIVQQFLRTAPAAWNPFAPA